MEVVLLFSVMPKEISIDLLSDGDFLEVIKLSEIVSLPYYCSCLVVGG